MSSVTERFLRYVSFDTMSDENSPTCPSTAKQKLLGAAIVEELAGFQIIPGMASLEEGFATVGAIAIVLAGAFPLVKVITKLLRKPLMALGKRLGINEVAAGGLIATLANSIATFEQVKNMELQSGTTAVNVAALANGLYIVKAGNKIFRVVKK